jgi:hypothetical protein
LVVTPRWLVSEHPTADGIGEEEILPEVVPSADQLCASRVIEGEPHRLGWPGGGLHSGGLARRSVVACRRHDECAADLLDHWRDAPCGVGGDCVRKGWGEGGNVVMADLVPHRQNHLGTTGHLSIDEAVELVLRPVLREERWTEDHDAEPAVRKAVV